MLPEAEAFSGFGWTIQAGATTQGRVKSVGGDEDASLQLPGRCLQLDGIRPSLKARDRGSPSDLDAAPGGRPRQCSREGRPPDAEPSAGRELAGDRGAVLLDVADSLDRGAVLGAEKLTRSEGRQDPQARRHEPLPARLVRRPGAPLADDRPEAGPRGERGNGQAGGPGTDDSDIDVDVGSRRHGRAWL